tara:strand:+ start:2983 stop:4737 length:1755 start_codon:yes stop_codon:yes gene_type:complete
MKFKNTFQVILLYAILFNIFLIFINLNPSQGLLFRLIPSFLLVNYFLLFILLLLSFKNIKNEFKKIDKKIWIALLLILLLGFSLRMFVAPHAHRVLFDEDIYLNVAQNIKNELKACLCDYGTTNECYTCIPNKQPHAYSTFISIFFFFFGVKESVAYTTTIIIGTLSIFLIFAVVYLLFRRQSTALYASLIFTLIPEHIRWSATTSLGPFFVFTTLLTVILFLLYFRTKSYLILTTAILSFAIALQGRPEAGLLVILIGLLFILFNKNLLKDIKNYRFILLILLLMILITPNIIHIKKVSSSAWGSPGEKFSLDYMDKNAKDNTKFFFENTRFPVIFTILAIIGMICSAIRRKKELLLLLTWFFLFFGSYALFYAGSFNYGTDVRFSLNLYTSIAIFAAVALAFIENILSKINSSINSIKYYFLKLIIKKEYFNLKRPEKSRIAIWSVRVIISLLVLFSMVPFINYISTYGDKAWDAKAVHDFAVAESEKMQQKDCYVFSHTSSIFLVNGVNSLQTHFQTDNRIVNDIFKKTDCVLFYEGYWCVNVRAHKEGICKRMHDNFDLTVYSARNERNKNFTLYTVERK